MSQLIRRLVTAAALVAVLAPAALAGGVNAKVSGPMKDGKYFVYSFARTWPESGTWAIRMALGNAHAPVTITALDEHGAVKANKLIWDSDGTKECTAILNGGGC